jgi:enoyl-[acyl-carrier protein] reductase I
VFKSQGADLTITYQNAKAEPYVRPVAERLEADIIAPLDVRDDDQYAQLFDQIDAKWGEVDVCLHSVAFCPKADLRGAVDA